MYYDKDNPIKPQISLAKERIRLVAQGHMVCCALFGPAGIGKTHLCREVFRELNMREGQDWMLTRGSGVGLLHNVYAMRDGGTLLLDDCDELVIGGGQTHTNRMKELLAPEKIRRINNYTKAAMEGKDSIPETFLTTCGAVWLTNIDLSQIDKKTEKRIEPLKSRGMIPSVIDGDPRNAANYVLSLVADDGVRLVAGQNAAGMNIHLNREEANDVLRYFAMNAWNLETICVRRLNHLAKYRRLSPERWKDLADQELRKESICNYPLPPVPYIADPNVQTELAA